MIRLKCVQLKVALRASLHYVVSGKLYTCTLFVFDYHERSCLRVYHNVVQLSCV
jgi:hypothetical protein